MPEYRKLHFKITGGVIDLRFFLGDENPNTCVEMYHNYLGKYII